MISAKKCKQFHKDILGELANIKPLLQAHIVTAAKENNQDLTANVKVYSLSFKYIGNSTLVHDI